MRLRDIRLNTHIKFQNNNTQVVNTGTIYFNAESDQLWNCKGNFKIRRFSSEDEVEGRFFEFECAKCKSEAIVRRVDLTPAFGVAKGRYYQLRMFVVCPKKRCHNRTIFNIPIFASDLIYGVKRSKEEQSKKPAKEILKSKHG